MYEVMLSDMWKYLYSESVFTTLHWDKTQNVKKISFGQNEWYKTCPLFFCEL